MAPPGYTAGRMLLCFEGAGGGGVGGGGGAEGVGRVEGGEGDECGEDDSSSGTFGCYCFKVLKVFEGLWFQVFRLTVGRKIRVECLRSRA